MGRPPAKCPMCKEVWKWKCVDTTKDSPNLSTALWNFGRGVGNSGSGKMIKTFCCGKCGFKQEYKY